MVLRANGKSEPEEEEEVGCRSQSDTDEALEALDLENVTISNDGSLSYQVSDKGGKRRRRRG